MTSPERRQEAAGVSAVFHAALTQLGFKALAEAITLWADVPATKAGLPAASGRWITYALSMVGKRRIHARRLAISYYRLVRALHTGYTVYDPLAEKPTSEFVPLTQLRDEFYEQVEEYAPEVLEGEEVEVPGEHAEDTEDFSDVPASDSSGYTDEELIELEEIEALEEELARQEAAAEEEARIVLEALGPNNLDKKLDDVDGQSAADDADQRREDARRQAGNRQAAAAERVVQNGARATLDTIAEKDPRAIGFVRVSRTGTPCGWCAMLISRGLIFYRSENSATYREDGQLYHDNCHCYAEPVFSYEQYAEDPRFDLNREYAALWADTDGVWRRDGESDLTSWRRYFRNKQG